MKQSSRTSFDEAFPLLTVWALQQGRIEIGYEPYTNSFIRVLDEGGDMWKGRSSYKSVEAALAHAEKGSAPLIRDKCRLD